VKVILDQPVRATAEGITKLFIHKKFLANHNKGRQGFCVMNKTAVCPTLTSIEHPCLSLTTMSQSRVSSEQAREDQLFATFPTSR